MAFKWASRVLRDKQQCGAEHPQWVRELISPLLSDFAFSSSLTFSRAGCLMILPIVLRLQPIALLFLCEWGSLSPGSVKTSDLPEKNWISFTFKLIVHEHCLMPILYRVKTVGVILAEENNVLWQSVSVCFGDWQIVLHRSSLILILSVVWL